MRYVIGILAVSDVLNTTDCGSSVIAGSPSICTTGIVTVSY